MGLSLLPEECVSLIISYTSPRDACRLSVVSPAFRSAVDSDIVWQKFLPSDCHEIISQSSLLSSSSSSSLPQLPFSTDKDLFFYLCRRPILICSGNMSFGLEKESGKKCYMVGSRGLSIIWSETPQYWSWTSVPESRFSEVAKLNYVWWLDIKAKLETRILSPNTTYAAYFVFKFAKCGSGFKSRAVNMRVYFERSESTRGSSVFLDPPENMPQLCREIGDGWMEIEMGEFYNDNGDDGTVVCSLMEVNNFTTKEGLIVEGIEVRPK